MKGLPTTRWFATIVLLCLGGGLAALPADDFQWSPRQSDGLEPSVNLTFSLDMAGPGGVFEFTDTSRTPVQILEASLLLSQDGSATFSEELHFDLLHHESTNAQIRSIDIGKGKTSVAFTSTLNFVRKAAGLLNVTYARAGQVKTVYNNRLMESRLVGRWRYAGEDSFPVLFRANGTVAWGNGAPPLPFVIQEGLLSFGEEPMFQRNGIAMEGESLNLVGPEMTIRLVRDLGTDRNTDGGSAPVPQQRLNVNRLKAPEDYEFEEVGQRVNWGAGDEVLEGFSNPGATKQTITGSKNGLRFVVVSSDPAQAIVMFKGGKEVGRRSGDTGFLLGAVLEDETDSIELQGVGFNPESKHFNTWCEMYMTSSVEDATEQAKSILATWQIREKKPWVVFWDSDGTFEDLLQQ